VDWKALEIVHRIDVGGSEHWGAISQDRDPQPVRRFACFTIATVNCGSALPWLFAMQP
jgi:hypothetical protein